MILSLFPACATSGMGVGLIFFGVSVTACTLCVGVTVSGVKVGVGKISVAGISARLDNARSNMKMIGLAMLSCLIIDS